MGRIEPLTLEEIRPTFAALLRGPLALAVSGGADSVALMHLLAEWLREPGTAERQGMGEVPLRVLTVDHRLRAESADEAAWVAREAGKLALPHDTLVWSGPKPASGLQAAAREARYRLMNGLLDAEALAGSGRPKRALVTAHHADDQAETFLMRLARGSGLDGLSGIRERDCIALEAAPGVQPTRCALLRPLLQVPKARLVAALEARGITWRDDPSNRSDDFERVRVRQALAVLDGLGIGAEQIARSARRLARARSAALSAMDEVLRDVVRWHGGLYGEIAPRLFGAYPEEYRVRTLAVLLGAYGGSAAPARLSQIEALVEQLSAGTGGRVATTLGGCRVEREGDGPVRVWRELGRSGLPVLDLEPGTERVWDGRFAVSAAAEVPSPVQVRALGADRRRLPPEEEARINELAGPDVPEGAVETLPSFWRDGRLLGVASLDLAMRGSSGLSARFIASASLQRTLLGPAEN